MRRDWQLIRYVLVAIEALDPSTEENSAVWPNSFDGYSTHEVSYHMRLLMQAGLIEATCREGGNEEFCLATSLSWQGHELLDIVRSDLVWEQIQQLLDSRGQPLSFKTIINAADVLMVGKGWQNEG